MNLFNLTIHRLEKGLDHAVMKNKMIAGNIANADTPNYKAQQIDFKNMLDHANEQVLAERTHPKHLPSTPLKQSHLNVGQRFTTFNHNGNNVDMDKEMAELAENQIYYRALVDRLNGKFGLLHTVIRGGR
jgi:flagellar basal-body rod protein FlgB